MALGTHQKAWIGFIGYVGGLISTLDFIAGIAGSSPIIDVKRYVITLQSSHVGSNKSFPDLFLIIRSSRLTR